MKIVVKVTVEMTADQAEGYCELNGIERQSLRDDIRDYVRSALQDAPAFTAGQADVHV